MLSGKLENFDHDWAAVNHMYGMNLSFDHKIGMHPTSKDPNNVHKEFDIIMKSKESSDVALVEALCHLLFVDYMCFNYPIPAACMQKAK